MNNILSKEFTSAVNQIAEEKGIAKEVIEEVVGQALAAAFRKDYGGKNQNIRCLLNLDTGRARFFDVKKVIDLKARQAALEAENASSEVKTASEAAPEVKIKETQEQLTVTVKFEPKFEIDLPEAKALIKTNDKIKVRKIIEEEKAKDQGENQTSRFLGKAKLIKPAGKNIKADKVELWLPLEEEETFGRIAAQTAKQVILQRLREAEREVIFTKFKDREGQLVTGTIQREEMGDLFVDLGQTTAILPKSEQIRSERYTVGSRIKALLREVKIGPKGPEVVLSRTADEVVKLLFLAEVPEMQNGTVEVMAIAREPGSRTKIAVRANDDQIDPIGSCVGQRGSRVTTVIAELNGEKIDIILWDKKAEKFVANALSPAKVKSVKLNEQDHSTVARVDEDQLSLAIGRDGQNVRLAARLSGWNIDVKPVDNNPKADKEIKDNKDKETVEK